MNDEVGSSILPNGSMNVVYILKSIKDRYYIGSTTDIDRRLRQHAKGQTPSTRRLGQMELVFKQEFDNLKQARLIEAWLKKLKRKDYIEKIITDGKINKL